MCIFYLFFYLKEFHIVHIGFPDKAHLAPNGRGCWLWLREDEGCSHEGLGVVPATDASFVDLRFLAQGDGRSLREA